MDDKTRHKRALEDISHFFLSGDSSGKPLQQTGAKEAEPSLGNDPASGAESRKTEVAPDDHAGALKIARPAAAPMGSKESIIKAVGDYLRSRNTEHLTTVKSIGSPRFGVADLTLLDKKNFFVLCARIQHGALFSDFLAACMGYYGWLSDCLQAGSLFFSVRPRLVLHLFCDRCPSSAPFIVEQLNAAMSIRMARYHLLQVPGDPAPVAYFQPLVPAEEDGTDQERQSPDFSEDDWRRFNRLRERASEE